MLEVKEAASNYDGKGYPNCYRTIPSNGEICTYSGLKHAKLYKMLSENGCARPYVRTVQLRDPGAAKGVTLYHVGDLMRYLDKLAAEQISGGGANPPPTLA